MHKDIYINSLMEELHPFDDVIFATSSTSPDIGMAKHSLHICILSERTLNLLCQFYLLCQFSDNFLWHFRRKSTQFSAYSIS